MMANEELERRVEDLEAQVHLLTEALRSTLDWKVRNRSVAQLSGPAKDFYIGGQEVTRVLLGETRVW